MKIVFRRRYLSDLYYKGKTTNREYCFQPEIIIRYKMCIDALESAANIGDLFQINSFRYEVTRSNKKDISSVRIDDQYSLEFTTSEVKSETIVTIFNILELSSQYELWIT